MVLGLHLKTSLHTRRHVAATSMMLPQYPRVKSNHYGKILLSPVSMQIICSRDRQPEPAGQAFIFARVERGERERRAPRPASWACLCSPEKREKRTPNAQTRKQMRLAKCETFCYW